MVPARGPRRRSPASSILPNLESDTCMATCKRVGLIALWALIFAPGASAQVGVSVQWLYPIESLYLADLSPYTVGAQPEFLSILLTGGGTGQNVVLEVSL